DITAPAVTISGAGELNCSITSLTLTADQTAASYAWTLNSAAVGGNTQTIAATAAGDYAVTVTYANGCTATSADVTVTQDIATPTVNLTGAVNNDEINCSVPSYTLGYTVSSGTVVSQTWSDASIGTTLTTSDAGTYAVVVNFDNGCSTSSN